MLLHFVLPLPPAPASQHWRGESSTISSARFSVVQPGGSGDTSADSVEAEPHSETRMKHLAGRLAVAVVFAAAEVKGSWILVKAG